MAWTPGATSSSTESSLTPITRAYIPPMVRIPEPGSILLRISAACACFFLAERVIRNIAPIMTTMTTRNEEFTADRVLCEAAREAASFFGGGPAERERQRRTLGDPPWRDNVKHVIPVPTKASSGARFGAVQLSAAPPKRSCWAGRAVCGGVAGGV